MWLKSVAIGRGWVGRMSERILVVMVVMCEGMCVHSCHMLVERCAVGVERIGGRLRGHDGARTCVEDRVVYTGPW